MLRKLVCRSEVRVKAGVHWPRVSAISAESSPNLTWAAMRLRADSVRPQCVSGSARTDSRRTESARNPIAAHVKFGDDCANAQPLPVDGHLKTKVREASE